MSQNTKTLELLRRTRVLYFNTRSKEMGKDKCTFALLSSGEQTFYKELAERCESDCASVLQSGGLSKDFCKESWLKGFQYAGERIEKIFELSTRGAKNEKTKN